MLTENQEKYLLKIPADKIVKIHPYDPKVENIVDGIIEQIKASGIGLEVKFMGASALGIAGQKDIDLYILCPEVRHKIYLSLLEKIFGKRVQGLSIIKWEFARDEYLVEMYLTDPTTNSMQEQIKVFEILKTTPNLLKEYEQIKVSADGLPFREYMKRKYKFYNRILGLS